MTDVGSMEAYLSRIVVSGAIAHAENILVLLRQHEAEGLDHETSIRTIYKEVSGEHVQ